MISVNWMSGFGNSRTLGEVRIENVKCIKADVRPSRCSPARDGIGEAPSFMGAPHRLKYFRKVFEQIRRKSDVQFCTGEQIFDWFLSVGPKAP